MAVPKKKISKSRRGHRRGGNGAKRLSFPNITVDSVTGEYKIAHHLSPTGYYNGKRVIEEKVKEESDKLSDESN
jgi:large subunit ribosomal protein L32